MSRIDSLDIQITASANQASASIDSLTRRLGVLSSNLSSVGGQSSTAFRRLSSAFSDLTPKVTKNNISIKGLGTSFTNLYHKIQMTEKAIKAMSNVMKESISYIENLNYYTKAFEQVAQNADYSSFQELGYSTAQEYADSFAERAGQLTAKMTGFKIGDNGMLEETGGVSLGLNPSELMTHQATFAQMANSMGATSEQSLKLSNAMTMLGADLASVKNMDFNKVWTDMQSGLAGMSRTMDKYGVNIRLVNLQLELQKIGINKSVQALNQNEKAMLRTIIMVNATKYAHADLSETLLQPANQLRILTANFQNLARTIGNLFLPTLAKVLPYLNAVVMTVQRMFSWFAKLVGINLSKITSGVGNTDISESIGIGDVEEDLKDATKAAEKLKGQLQGFDELNNLSSQSSNASDSGVGLGAGDAALLNDAFNKAIDDYTKAWEEAFKKVQNQAKELTDAMFAYLEPIRQMIKNLYEGNYEAAGENLGEFFMKLMDIDWSPIYEKASGFGTGLAQFLNGLISPELFGKTGETLASALNTAVYAALAFGTTFDWTNWGTSVAEGINRFFETFDFKALAETINAWLIGALEATSTMLKETDFQMIGEKIGEFLVGIDWSGILLGVGETIWEGLKGAIELASGMFSVAPIETTLIGAIAAMPLASTLETLAATLAGSTFGTKLTEMFALWSGGAGTFGESFMAVFGAGGVATVALGAFAAGLGITFATNEEVRQSFDDAVASIETGLVPLLDLLTNTILPGLQAGWEGFLTILEPIGDFVETVFVSIWQDMLNPALKYLGETVLPIVTETLSNLWNNVLVPLGSFIGGVLSPIVDTLAAIFTAFWQNVVVPLAGALGNVLGKAFEGIADIMNNMVIPVFGAISKTLKFLWENLLGPIAKYIMGTFATVFKTVFKTIGGIIEGLSTTLGGVIDFITGAFAGNWEKAWNGIVDVFKGIFNGIGSIVEGVLNVIIDGLNFFVGGFDGIANTLGQIIGVDIKIPLIPAVTIPKFATGGFPEDGLFFANHGEMVGKFSNGKTAVANNEQITQGIAQAVYPAVYDAMTAALSQNGGAQVTFKVEGDPNRLFKVVKEENYNQFKRTGRNALAF